MSRMNLFISGRTVNTAVQISIRRAGSPERSLPFSLAGET